MTITKNKIQNRSLNLTFLLLLFVLKLVRSLHKSQVFLQFFLQLLPFLHFFALHFLHFFWDHLSSQGVIVLETAVRKSNSRNSSSLYLRAKICIKYKKHGSFSFSHTFNCVCLSQSHFIEVAQGGVSSSQRH